MLQQSKQQVMSTMLCLYFVCLLASAFTVKNLKNDHLYSHSLVLISVEGGSKVETSYRVFKGKDKY